METIFNINRNAFDALFMKILTGLWDCHKNKTGRVLIIRVRVRRDYFLRFHDLNKLDSVFRVFFKSFNVLVEPTADIKDCPL